MRNFINETVIRFMNAMIMFVVFCGVDDLAYANIDWYNYHTIWPQMAASIVTAILVTLMARGLRTIELPRKKAKKADPEPKTE